MNQYLCTFLVNEPCIVHQDCHGEFLECDNLKCVVAPQELDKVKEIGVQTSFTDVEMKNASTSIDNTSLSAKTKTEENDDTMRKDKNYYISATLYYIHSVRFLYINTYGLRWKAMQYVTMSGITSLGLRTRIMSLPKWILYEKWNV